jgi:hypothetical protein
LKFPKYPERGTNPTREVLRVRLKAAEQDKEKLVPNFRVPAWLRPYVMRMKPFGVGEFVGADRLRLHSAVRQMEAVLAKKGVRGTRARHSIRRTLDAATRHQLEKLQLDQIDFDHACADKKRRQLIRHIQRLKQETGSPPPDALSKKSIGGLNRVIAQADWTTFDTETYTDLMLEFVDVLKAASPPRVAERGLDAIFGPLRLPENPSVRKLVREGTPAVIALWETMPSDSRSCVEKDLRSWTPSKRDQLSAFLGKLIELLRKHKPNGKLGRRKASERLYLERVKAICKRVGLCPSSAYNGYQIEQVGSPFQQYLSAALQAVGDSATVSRRQAQNLRERRAIDSPSSSKRL